MNETITQPSQHPATRQDVAALEREIARLRRELEREDRRDGWALVHAYARRVGRGRRQ